MKKTSYQVGHNLANHARKVLDALYQQLNIFQENQEIVRQEVDENPDTIAKRYYRTLSKINENSAITNAINAFLRDNPPNVIQALQELLEGKSEEETAS